MATNKELEILKRDQSVILLKYACEELFKGAIACQLTSIIDETFALSEVFNSAVQNVWLKVSRN